MLKHHLILCADDDADDQVLFSEAIQMAIPAGNYQVEFAKNGIEVLTKLSGMPIPTILFLDLNMPQMDGLSCLKDIRSDRKYDNMPIVILSTGHREEDISAAFKSDADNYAVKPICIKDLATLLATCLQKFFY
ncbi:CheY-like chemotaxis protein [Filimonas zeae]|uniref:Response regulatory domain-containing protein n=1 Tax=Filimonas zeae TaxID=1737353 RepID=A0A917J1T4_9BACT|nr:response regulator [Filimonas zeae]MDR6339974.1 CheY-like chemotaxis protein [Filimonas zeae]GGH70535.1 hypothetical protein GCM10011379_28920 [Filimonas zeae]